MNTLISANPCVEGDVAVFAVADQVAGCSTYRLSAYSLMWLAEWNGDPELFR
jgi:hypothetical protein